MEGLATNSANFCSLLNKSYDKRCDHKRKNKKNDNGLVLQLYTEVYASDGMP